MRVQLELRVLYDAPALDCRRVLRVLPLPRLPDESGSERLSIFPAPDSQKEERDAHGNRVLRVFHRRIEREFRLHLEVCSSHFPAPDGFENPSGWQKMPSRATPFAPELLEIARAHRAFPPPARARLLNELVWQSLEYRGQTSDHPANAGLIWQARAGSCADFAHVLIALGRAAGLAARYVAGFGPAPGALHAWVEFAFEGAWHGFDPTHGRELERVQALYLPVATGRDFYDCAPHRGQFRGQGARLELHCTLDG